MKNLKEHHRRYESFSTLLRMTFDQALEQFQDRSVDLLRHDGCHAYEAVKRDYETWLPKMSESGIILFHDTAVFERGLAYINYGANCSTASDISTLSMALD